MKRIFAFLFAAAALAGCSDDNGGDGGKDIQLAPGTPKDYTIFADEASGTPSEGISFTTAGPWRATVAETRAEVSGGSPSWVTVTPDHGDAADAVAEAAQENLRLRFKGYRVCIFFDNGQDARAGAEAARELFASTYPSTKVYISYNAPYFTVTAGDCVTAEEAIILMGRIRTTFPKAFPRSEELTVADLVN